MKTNDQKIGVEKMGGSNKKKIGVEFEEKESKVEDVVKVMIEQEGQTTEKSYDEEKGSPEGEKKKKEDDKKDTRQKETKTEENPGEASKLLNNKGQMVASRPNDSILTIEEKTQEESSEIISNKDQASDSDDDEGSLCWYLGQCCKNFCLMFFCGVCCLFKKSAREEAFTGVHYDWIEEDDPNREDQWHKKDIKSETYLG